MNIRGGMREGGGGGGGGGRGGGGGGRGGGGGGRQFDGLWSASESRGSGHESGPTHFLPMSGRERIPVALHFVPAPDLRGADGMAVGGWGGAGGQTEVNEGLELQLEADFTL
ncbi:hypothetical protein EYF80_049688 [Liparis tanakae]|uniref:Uncharacterized protein n=1 Tax=Liparis tanakae TaxID=230148 RepID=A0A4Z2FGX5_9TELE|nr:hypothetical protein EYF80_049688 [Liparis tanakae]